jgi:hypothetical protein
LTSLAGVPLVVGRKDEKGGHRIMSTPDHDCLDAETILNDLCASKIDASISWIGMADSILSSVIRRRLRAGLSQPSARLPSPSETKHALITRIATSRGNMADSSRSSVAEGEVTKTSLKWLCHGRGSGSPMPIIAGSSPLIWPSGNSTLDLTASGETLVRPREPPSL